jgi:hypothetical protein
VNVTVVLLAGARELTEPGIVPGTLYDIAVNIAEGPVIVRHGAGHRPQRPRGRPGGRPGPVPQARRGEERQVTTGQRWLFVAVCITVALAANTALHLTRRRRHARRTERTRP